MALGVSEGRATLCHDGQLKIPSITFFFLCVCMMTRRKNINKATAKSLYISRTDSYFHGTEIMFKIYYFVSQNFNFLKLKLCAGPNELSK